MTYEVALAELLRLGFNLFEAYHMLYEASKMGSYRANIGNFHPKPVIIYCQRGAYAVESKTLAKG